MIGDYINKDVVSTLTFSEFKESFSGNVEISKHKLTLREAYNELGGGTNKPKSEKKKEKKNIDKY